MPNIGDRVLVRPRGALQVQRGEGLYGQVIPQEGMECTWDDFLEARQGEGCIEIVQQAAPAPVEGPPAIPSIPPLPRGRRGEEPA